MIAAAVRAGWPPVRRGVGLCGRSPPPGLRPRGPYAVIIAQTIFVRNYSIGALFPILDSCLSNFLVSVKCT